MCIMCEISKVMEIKRGFMNSFRVPLRVFYTFFFLEVYACCNVTALSTLYINRLSKSEQLRHSLNISVSSFNPDPYIQCYLNRCKNSRCLFLEHTSHIIFAKNKRTVLTLECPNVAAHEAPQ